MSWDKKVIPGTVAGGGADNLGNHTATQNLDMATFAIVNVGNVDGRDVSADGLILDALDSETLQITDILRVDGARGDAYVEDGSLRRPYKTIGAAITAAAGGEIILIHPGTYSEQITLKSGVSLVGTERDRVLITNANDVVTVPTGAICVLKDLKVIVTGAGQAAIKMDTATGGWLKIQNVYANSADATGYSIYMKDSANMWGRRVDCEGGQAYFENSSGINFDGMQFYGDDAVTAVYVKDCSTSDAVVLRGGAILGINAVTGNIALQVEN